MVDIRGNALCRLLNNHLVGDVVLEEMEADHENLCFCGMKKCGWQMKVHVFCSRCKRQIGEDSGILWYDPTMHVFYSVKFKFDNIGIIVGYDVYEIEGSFLQWLSEIGFNEIHDGYELIWFEVEKVEN